MSAFVVWGFGAATSEIVRGAEVFGDPEDIGLAMEKDPGFVGGDEWWVCSVECDEADLDAQTRFDRAVRGYCAAPETAS